MKKISIKGTTKFMGIELPNIYGGFGEGKKAILVKSISSLHGMNVANINQRINNNRPRFEDDIDIIDLKTDTSNVSVLKQLGFTKAQIGNSKHIYLLSERGYYKLVKILETDLAWEIYSKLLNEYFTMKQVTQQLSEEDMAILRAYKGKATMDDVDLIMAAHVEPMKSMVRKLARGEDKVIKQSDVAEKLSVELPLLKLFFVKLGWFEEKRFLRRNAMHEHDFENKIHHQPTRLFIEEVANKGLAGTKPADERGKIIVEFFDGIVPYILNNYGDELQSFVKAQRYEFFSN